MKKTLFILALAAVILMCAGCQKKKPEEIINEAQMKMRRGDFIGARIDLKELIQKHPADPAIPQARFLLSQCYYYENDFPQVREQLAEVYKMLGLANPMGRDAFKVILSTYRTEKKFQDGIKEAQNLVKSLPPDDVFGYEINCMISDLMMDDKKTSEAISHLENLIPIGKNHDMRMTALERLVAIHAIEKNFDAAIKAYADYNEKYGDEKTRDNLIAGQAFFYEQKGDTEKAKEYFAKAVDGYKALIEKTLDKTEKADWTFRLGRTYEIQKDYESAQKIYQSIVEQYGDTPLRQPAQLAIGDLYYAQDKKEKALEYLQGLLKENPQDQEFVNMIRNRLMALMREKSQAGATTGSLQQRPDKAEQPSGK